MINGVQLWLMGQEMIPTPERAHGEYETVRAYSNEFVKLSQVRGSERRVDQELKGKILADGLLNPIDIVRADARLMQEYIAFVNATWGSETDIRMLDDQQRDDQTYLLVIAGHSRHTSIEELEEEGLIQPRPILAKVHDVDSVWDIIRLQLSENAHSKPSEDRVAMATVEAYRWGIKEGRWRNKKEFLDSQYGTASSNRMLKDALSFHELPLDVTKFVTSGTISYSAGVEMGKSVPVIREFLLKRAGFSGPEDTNLDQALLEKMIKEELFILANNIVNRRMSQVNAKRYVAGWRRGRETNLKDFETNDEQALTLTFVSPSDQLKEEQVRNLRALRQQLIEMAQNPSTHFLSALRFNGAVVGEENAAEAVKRMEADLTATLRDVGSQAVKASIHY